MKTIILLVLFSINGSPHTKEGWGPRVVSDMETCLQYAENIENYIGEHADTLAPLGGVYCGPPEGVAAFIANGYNYGTGV